MHRIVGVDPGKTTGIMSFTVLEDGTVSCIEPLQLDFIGAGLYLSQRLKEGDIVACESYRFMPKKAQDYSAPEVIGLVRYFCSRLGSDLIMQTPSAVKSLVSNEVLRRSGLYVQGDHARDASRHAVYAGLTQLGLFKDALREGS